MSVVDLLGASAPDVDSAEGFITLLYFAGAGLITLGIETLRRWVKRRMDIWEAQHPIPKSVEKEEEDG